MPLGKKLQAEIMTGHYWNKPKCWHFPWEAIKAKINALKTCWRSKGGCSYGDFLLSSFMEAIVIKNQGLNPISWLKDFYSYIINLLIN